MHGNRYKWIVQDDDDDDDNDDDENEDETNLSRQTSHGLWALALVSIKLGDHRKK